MLHNLIGIYTDDFYLSPTPQTKMSGQIVKSSVAQILTAIATGNPVEKAFQSEGSFFIVIRLNVTGKGGGFIDTLHVSK